MQRSSGFVAPLTLVQRSLWQDTKLRIQAYHELVPFAIHLSLFRLHPYLHLFHAEKDQLPRVLSDRVPSRIIPGCMARAYIITRG